MKEHETKLITLQNTAGDRYFYLQWLIADLLQSVWLQSSLIKVARLLSLSLKPAHRVPSLSRG